MRVADRNETLWGAWAVFAPNLRWYFSGDTGRGLGAAEKLQANYPDCAHDFPPEVRKVAYEFLDRWLK